MALVDSVVSYCDACGERLMFSATIADDACRAAHIYKMSQVPDSMARAVGGKIADCKCGRRLRISDKTRGNGVSMCLEVVKVSEDGGEDGN